MEDTPWVTWIYYSDPSSVRRRRVCFSGRAAGFRLLMDKRITRRSRRAGSCWDKRLYLGSGSCGKQGVFLRSDVKALFPSFSLSLTFSLICRQQQRQHRPPPVGSTDRWPEKTVDVQIVGRWYRAARPNAHWKFMAPGGKPVQERNR